MLWISPLHEASQWTVQLVVLGAHGMAAAVPGADGFAGGIVQHPALAGFHAGLMNSGAQHVVVVHHDLAAERVDHRTLIPFEVQIHASAVFAIDAVVGECEKSSTQCVEMRCAWRVRMLSGFGGGIALGSALPRVRPALRRKRGVGGIGAQGVPVGRVFAGI